MPDLYDIQIRHAKYYLGLLHRTDELFRQGGESAEQALNLFDLDWRNIQAGIEWTTQSRYEFAARLGSAYDEAGASLLTMRLKPRTLIKYMQSALVTTLMLREPTVCPEIRRK